MPKEQKIRLSSKSRITQRFNKKGEIVESYTSTDLLLPKSSLKAKRLNVVERLQKLADECQIGGAFANSVARVVMGWKPNPHWKKYKPKDFILTAKNQLRFNRSFITERTEFQEVLKIILERTELGIESLDKLNEMLWNRYTSMMCDYPRDFLTLPLKVIDFYNPTKYSSLLRHWYERFSGQPDWTFDKVPDDEIKAIFLRELDKVQAEVARSQNAPG